MSNVRSTEIKRATRGFSFVFQNQVMYIQTTYFIGTQEKIRSGVDIYLPGHIDNTWQKDLIIKVGKDWKA